MNKRTRVLLCLLPLIALSPALHASGFAEKTVSWLQGYGLQPTWIVLIISMLPLIELRGSIPVAILLFNMHWSEAVLLSVVGNMIPIPFILLLMDRFFALISKNRHGARFSQWIFKRTRRKGKVIETYEALGLTIFVGIPLPGTGAWTGSFAANIFGIRFWRAMLYIFVGVLLAATVVTMLSLMGNMAVSSV
ncbi:MAG: small multi-drug export protein [Candidatus Cloacimonadaceae bacterium]|nr:small multi-drug export protein [Candidatus Cloacimonadaceae bacterium]